VGVRPAGESECSPLWQGPGKAWCVLAIHIACLVPFASAEPRGANRAGNGNQFSPAWGWAADQQRHCDVVLFSQPGLSASTSFTAMMSRPELSSPRCDCAFCFGMRQCRSEYKSACGLHVPSSQAPEPRTGPARRGHTCKKGGRRELSLVSQQRPATSALITSMLDLLILSSGALPFRWPGNGIQAERVSKTPSNPKYRLVFPASVFDDTDGSDGPDKIRISISIVHWLGCPASPAFADPVESGN
jgi:hypothetical protein